MTFNELINDPFQRERITHHHVWWDNAFSEEELDNIVTLCNSETLDDATTIGTDNQNFVREIRRSKVKFINKNQNTSWIFDRFNDIADKLNQQFFQFELYGYDAIQYTTYDGSEQGQYDWHMDSFIDGSIPPDMAGTSQRKLTIVMLLNDPNNFTGGQFQLNTAKEINAETINLERGMLIGFPSFLIHRVSPVLSGIRKSMVIWIEGPKFR